MTMAAYNDDVAGHYAAYRPPLHRPILHDGLGDRCFTRALDIGCGTGRSTVSLCDRCDGVTGLDKSAEMIRVAERHRQVIYRQWSAGPVPVPEDSVDLVTMAGVLSYLDVGGLVPELMRVCLPEAAIVVYDFELALAPLMMAVGVGPSTQANTYDHALNLDGIAGVTTERTHTGKVGLSLTAEQAAHVLLSSMTRRPVLVTRFGTENLFACCVEAIKASSWPGQLPSRIWWAVHGFTP